MTTPSKKEQTHERILRSAARAIRREGYQGVSVADIMKDAGLTHGGFYAHFSSREALLAEALEAAAAETTQTLEDAIHKAGPDEGLEALLNAYLSDAHAKHVERGCALAALGSETRRQSSEVRSVTTQHVRRMLDLLESQLPSGDRAQRQEQAQAALSTLVGALILSRAVNDARLAQAFRTAAKRAIHDRND
ncbi:TetR/AcrR family transcriptional regulator [Myxococcus sp. Y35]|uniref:TetR/AcrR family transcriptional regulator n=1 Tax=Pseudomyxococcus flavus TaxID=3115648 RepID=UPI003CEC8BC0